MQCLELRFNKKPEHPFFVLRGSTGIVPQTRQIPRQREQLCALFGGDLPMLLATEPQMMVLDVFQIDQRVVPALLKGRRDQAVGRV